MVGMKPDATFRALHGEGQLLILPNAWDAGSARLIESLGARAVATSSAAVAWAHGLPDGEKLDRDTLLAAVAAMARAVRVPLSADVETGFARDAEGVADTIARVIDAGAVGVNLEDGSGAPEELARRIAVARRAAGRAGVELYINARTDVYLARLAPPERAAAETLRRAALYREAGADGLFVPYLKLPAEIAEVARGCGMPLNLLTVPGLAPAAELRALGVRRISAGSHVASAAWGTARRAAVEMLEQGTYGAAFADQMTYADMNKLMAR
jgi:2-methylisocitrate lyase-like PEP mutase family enzyme